MTNTVGLSAMPPASRVRQATAAVQKLDSSRAAGVAMQVAERPASFDEIISDPMFRAGYEDYWRGHPSSCDIRWADQEQLAYERGRHFGVYVKQFEEERIPLVRGAMPHPRAKLLLLLAMRDGDVR